MMMMTKVYSNSILVQKKCNTSNHADGSDTSSGDDHASSNHADDSDTSNGDDHASSNTTSTTSSCIS